MIIRVRRQDNTDLEKALDLIASSGRAEVMIAGATGERIDFTLANLAVFWNYTASLDICFRGDGWRAMPVGGKRSLTAPVGSVVSLLPFSSCTGISLRGLRYPLRNATMRLGTVGVSNVVRTPRFDVTVRRGNMLLVIFNRRKERIRW
jgi:thiamine pyrophosphokinase